MQSLITFLPEQSASTITKALFTMSYDEGIHMICNALQEIALTSLEFDLHPGEPLYQIGMNSEQFFDGGSCGSCIIFR